MKNPERWRKSTRSGGNGGDCVELREVAGRVDVRDSKNRRGPVLSFDRAAFDQLLAALKDGELQ